MNLVKRLKLNYPAFAMIVNPFYLEFTPAPLDCYIAPLDFSLAPSKYEQKIKTEFKYHIEQEIKAEFTISSNNITMDLKELMHCKDLTIFFKGKLFALEQVSSFETSLSHTTKLIECVVKCKQILEKEIL